MEIFVGKFKVIPELNEGFDAYFDAMSAPEILDCVRAMMKDDLNNLVTAILKAGDDSYKEWNDYGEAQEEFVFKLDQVSTTTTVGVETKHLFTLKDGRLDGEHDVAGQKTTTSRYFKGDQMIFEASGNGATMKTFFTRIPE